MTIGELIKQYREKHGLSQRQFAIKCNISNGYISMLERGINPKTKEPIMPSIALLKTFADTMGISLNELFSIVDDMPVNLSGSVGAFPKALSESEKLTQEALKLFSELTPEQQRFVLTMIKTMLKGE